MQYTCTLISNDCKNDNFQMKKSNIFLNLSSLLVKRQNDNPSGLRLGEISPKREVNRHTIIRQYSKRNQGFRDDIPIPDSSGEEANFIGIFTSRGYLKVHRVLISAAPNLGNKIISRYSGFTFQTFI